MKQPGNEKGEWRGKEVAEYEQHDDKGDEAALAEAILEITEGHRILRGKQAAQERVSVERRDRYQVEKTEIQVHEHDGGRQVRDYLHAACEGVSGNEREYDGEQEISAHAGNCHERLAPALVLKVVWVIRNGLRPAEQES